MTISDKQKRRGIEICFFMSGAAGLVYDVIWARQLGLFLGITSFAHTAVITAYMAGLAAGSLYFGRRTDNSGNPLRVYAGLEIGIALYALLMPFMFNWLQAGYASMAGVAGISDMSGHLARFSVALAEIMNDGNIIHHVWIHEALALSSVYKSELTGLVGITMQNKSISFG